MSFFAVDLIPSGSNDPYALRRQAFGIVRMIAAKHWRFSIPEMQRVIADALVEQNQVGKLDYRVHAEALTDFMRDRVKQYLQQEKIRHDVIDTVIAMPTADISAMIDGAAILSQHLDDKNFKAVIEAWGRVVRISDKEPTNGMVDPRLFDNDSEGKLQAAVEKVSAEFDQQVSDANYERLAALEPVITAYFTATMVMADDEKVRENRLIQLTHLASLIHQFGDVTALIVK